MLWVCRRSSVEAIVSVQSLLFYLIDPSDILTRLRYPFSNKKSQCAKIAFSGFLFVCVAFIFQSIFVIFCFFMFFINFSFCSMPTDFVWLLKFSKFFIFIWSRVLVYFFSWILYEISYLYFSNRFNLALMIVSEIWVSGSKNGPTPKMIAFFI